MFTKNVLIGFKKQNTFFFLNSLEMSFSKPWMCNLAKLILKVQRSLPSFSVAISVALNHFTRSEVINQL